MNESVCRILLVDDNEDEALLMERALQRVGSPIPVDRARDGEEAIAYLSDLAARTEGDGLAERLLVLLDLKMPRKNGLEVLAWIRSHPLFGPMPVVMLTSSAERRDVTQAYVLGANSYLVKPAEYSQLTELARRLCDYWVGLNESPELGVHSSA